MTAPGPPTLGCWQPWTSSLLNLEKMGIHKGRAGFTHFPEPQFSMFSSAHSHELPRPRWGDGNSSSLAIPSSVWLPEFSLHPVLTPCNNSVPPPPDMHGMEVGQPDPGSWREKRGSLGLQCLLPFGPHLPSCSLAGCPPHTACAAPRSSAGSHTLPTAAGLPSRPRGQR